MQIADGHERERDRSRDSRGDTDHNPEPEPRRLSGHEPSLGDDGSGAEQREQQAHRVVRLPAGDEDDHEQGEVGEPERAIRSRLGAAQEPPEPGDPERCEERADQQQLQRQQQHPVADRVLVADLVGELELRPAVVRLPEEVRHPEEERERGACPQPRLRARPKRRSRRQPQARAPSEDQHEILVLEPEADDEADEQPLPLVAAAEDAGHEQHHRHPDENVERRRREQMADRHRRARGGSRERGDCLARATRTELAGDERDEDDHDRDRDCRDDAQSARVVTERRFRQPAEQRRQRRLIVVPPGRMLRGDAEVQLVPVVAVAVRGRHEQRELGRRDGKNERPGDGGTAAIHYAWRLFPRAPTSRAQPLSSRAVATAWASM